MINTLKYLFVLFFVIGTSCYAQTSETITKTDYTVTSASGPQTLVATQSITIKPTSVIQLGSTFVAQISSDAYTALTFSNENYIFNRNYQKALKNSSEINSNKDVIESITYYDGLGRPMQKIAIKGSPSYKDIVTHIEYDNIGRNEKNYMPYPDLVDPTASYRSTAANNTNNYYISNYPSEISSITPNPFSQSKFEDSPDDRVLQQGAPGNDWALGNGHEIKLDYQSNVANEVKSYSVTLSLANNIYNPTLSLINYYASGQLYKTVTKNENWISGTNNTTEEFTDKQGHLILKKTYGVSVVNNAEINTPHETYYVYDDYGNLTFVIPPKADGQITQDVLADLCYQYKYDTKNRVVEKKLPGKDWEYIIYDKLDRIILTQDGNLRTSNKWLFTKFDAFNRAVYTGEYTDNINLSRLTVQIAANNNTSLFETRTITATTIGTATANYSNTSFPVGISPSSTIDLFTVNYYDDYLNLTAELNGGTSTTSYNVTPIINSKGLNTCTKIRILGTNDWINNVMYYDAKGRSIYNYTNNSFLHIVTTVKSQLDFGGKVLENTSTHQKLNQALITIIDTFTYDHIGRLLEQKQKINTQTQEIIASKTYDDLGHLIIQGVGGKLNQSRLQNITYKYNIRGWLKSINDSDTNNNTVTLPTASLFGFQINYNDSFTGKLFNGNISQTLWRTANIDPSLKSYNYTYDSLNRLKLAADNSTNNPGRYNESITYDKNGNIASILRLGNTDVNATIFDKMDELVYLYDNGNKLNKVDDLSSSVEGFKNGANALKEYDYDANGNMIMDLNKGIGTASTKGIYYNHLNLPTKIILATGTIDYVYDATGVKQSKSVSAGNLTEYSGGFLYENNILKFLPHSEGYVAINVVTFDYIYQYKDHLGNVRLSYGDKDNNGNIDNSEIIEENNYYPFGLKQKDLNNVTLLGKGNSAGQKYKYNGKELQDELGLNMYDYEARNYDPALGRFSIPDPMQELYYGINSYAYVFNNPIELIDPTGMIIEYANDPNKTKKENRQARRDFKRSQRELNRNSAEAKKNWNTLKNSNNVHTIHINEQKADCTYIPNNTKPKDGYKPGEGNGGGSNIYVNINQTTTQNEELGTSIINTAHEEGHAFRIDQGLVEGDYVSDMSNPDNINLLNLHVSKVMEKEEIEATHIENIVRAQLDPTKKKFPLRATYNNKELWRRNPFNNQTETYKKTLKTIRDGYDYYKKRN